jgi:NADH dehydrogenase
VVTYDTLIVATGASHHYFGNDEWAPLAPGLKTVEDALDIRRRIFLAFEAAEREPDPQKRQAWLTFFVVGGGPTGVELAGALAELAHSTLSQDFRQIDPAQARILLLEGAERILPPYPPELSGKAEAGLRKLSVTVLTRTLVTRIEDGTVTFRSGDRTEQMQARTILWAAGVRASSIGQVLAKQTGAQLDRAGRVMVERDLTLARYPNIFVIGDLANFSHQHGRALPGVAQVAMQQGRYVARAIKRRLAGKSLPPFHYRDKGSLAVIGRNFAVADLGFLRLDGMVAWLIWAAVHIRGLVEFDNKMLVLLQWAWHYVTRKVGARLITGQDPLPKLTSSVDSTFPRHQP